MRRAINAISAMFIGASVLTVISALIIPVLRKLPPTNLKHKTEMHRPLQSAEQPFDKSAIALNVTKPDAVEPNHTNFVDETKQKSTHSHFSSDQPAPATEPKTEPAPIVKTDQPAIEESVENKASPVIVEAAAAESNRTLSEPEPPATPPGKETATVHEPLTVLVLGQGIFPRGSVSPKDDIQQAIAKIIPLIQARPDVSVIVEGHADRKKSDEANRAQAANWNKIISLKRANEIATILKQQGVAKNRIIVRGLGDEFPIASNLNEEGREKNRRVEIKLSSH